MDENDDGSSSGLSGWAGYCLGVMAANSARSNKEFLARCFAPREREIPTYNADYVHEVIEGWKDHVRERDRLVASIKADRTAIRLERDELLAHNKVYGEESLAQLAYIRELTESREAALEGERLARIREDLQRIYVAELLEEIAELKAKG